MGVLWRWPALLLIASSVPASGAVPQRPLAFTTQGGEAWTFQKPIALTVRVGACDAIVLTSPITTVTERPQDGRVSAIVPLAPGENPVSAECRKGGTRVGESIAQHWLVRLKGAPKARAQVHVGDDGITLDAGGSEPAGSRPTPIRRYRWLARTGNPTPLTMPSEGERITLPAPAADGEYRVSLTITDECGRTDEAAVMFRIKSGKAQILDAAQGAPAWIDKAVIYGVMASAFEQPRLAAITARLDALQALGVDTLWLSPITASAPADFGYAVTGHFSLRDDVGSEADLHALIKAAHDRKMRVMMDFVPNHLSDRHPYYLHVGQHGRTSPYFDFFARTPANEAAHYFDWKNLKNLNYGNPEVQRMMIEAFAHWVRTFDIDGFRVDVAWGPRERAPEFWPRLHGELRRIKPDLLLLAEATARDGYYMRSGFDAAYDWTDKLGVWSWADAFAGDGNIAGRLRAALASERGADGVRVFRFLNNNDTGARFVTRHGAAKTRVAAAMLLTLPGIPGLYTGDEVGAEFEPYNQQGAIRWDDVHGLRPWYARLLRLRRSLPPLRARGLRIIDLPAASPVLAYLRPGAKAHEGILILLNYGSEPAEVALPADAIEELTSDGVLKDLLDGAEIRASGEGAIRLEGHHVRILQARK